MRAHGVWSEVCILNVGERGLGLQSACPPVRGTYVEICRGPHVMIGCVAWSSARRFGLRTQDCIAVEAVISEPDHSGGNRRTDNDLPLPFERRAAPRTLSARAERNRNVGRALEFTFVATLGVSAAIFGFSTVQQSIAKPMSSLAVALGSHRSNSPE